MAARTPKARCRCRGRVGAHVVHAGPCRARGPSGCVPLPAADGTLGGYACGYRPPCPCPWRTCRCGLAIAVCVELPAGTPLPPAGGEVMLVSVVRGSADRLGGRLAVWQLGNGMLGCRDVGAGQDLGTGEWRGLEHDEQACGYNLVLVAA